MGDHYATCREENCGVCGQLKGCCEHTRPTAQAKGSQALVRANDIQHGGTHYKKGKFQHWDLIARNRIGYLEGCATKYASRWADRGQPLIDLQKGVHYIDKIIEMAEEEGYFAIGSAPYSDLQLFFSENEITDPDAQMTIAHLCTWNGMMSLKLARKHMVALLEKAQKLHAQ